MDTIQISAETLRGVLWVSTLLVVDYTGVVAAVGADLCSGLRKASRRGEPRTSRGYRRTVDKALRYLATLFSLTLVDVILTLALLCLRSTAGISLPTLPALTTVGALFMVLVEAKSIMENLNEGTELHQAARTLTKLLADKRLHEIARKILEK